VSHVLIVDDEPAICWAFRECLTDEGMTVDIAGTAEQALKMSEQMAPDVVVMDVRLPGMDGLTALRKLQKSAASVPVIIMTAFGSLKTAVSAIEGGAFDYLTKPIDLEKAVSVVRQAIARTQTTAAPSIDNQQHELDRSDEELLVGSSAAMQDVFRRIALVADRDVPVLITGESGTGKDLVARAIHQHSRRKGQFIPVCIPALSETVVESELFGHVRGAFTGADLERRGLLELADDGTAFIDEIGDVPLNVQAKLLRVLESGEIRPVGSSQCRTGSFRLIAATNRHLEQKVSAGEFRSDLFYRLNVFRIEMPSLRDRLDDIPGLADRFLKTASGQRTLHLSDDALKELQSRQWRGNVRELRNVIESASVVCRGDVITPDHFPPELHENSFVSVGSASVKSLSEIVRKWTEDQLAVASLTTNDLYARFFEAAEPSLLEVALNHVHGRRGDASRLLGIHRETLREKLRKFESPAADTE
jgi:two-component system nitrogen regulation response regulator GlnG